MTGIFSFTGKFKAQEQLQLFQMLVNEFENGTYEITNWVERLNLWQNEFLCNILLCCTITQRFTFATSNRIRPLDFENPIWENAAMHLCEADASWWNMHGTEYGHYWFRLIPPSICRIFSVWHCTNHCLPKTRGRIGKPSRHQSVQQLSLIHANPANDSICQSRLSWWHLAFW